MKSNVPTPIEVLKEDLDMAVIGLQSVYKHIEHARRASKELKRVGSDTILGGYSLEIRDMLDGEVGQVGLAELRDGFKQEIEQLAADKHIQDSIS